MDLLSFCPSLVNILQEVEHKDILNCTLVNRRLLDVIKRNSLSMPRQRISLNICLLKEPSTQSRYVRIADFHCGHYCIYVTEEFTVLLQRSTAIENYYKDKRIQHWSPLSFVGEKIMKSIRVANVPRQDMGSHLIYSNDSLEEALRTLLSLLFRRYYFNTIEPSHDFPVELLKIVGDEFRKNRCKCNTLFSYYTMKGLQELITKLDCKATIYTERKSGSIPSMNAFVEITTVNKPIRVIYYQQYNSLQDMSNFLQKWQSGLFSLNKVTITTVPLFFLWPYHILNDLLLSVKEIISDTTDCSKNPDGVRTVHIARPHDKKVMCLTFHGRMYIELEEK